MKKDIFAETNHWSLVTKQISVLFSSLENIPFRDPASLKETLDFSLSTFETTRAFSVPLRALSNESQEEDPSHHYILMPIL